MHFEALNGFCLSFDALMLFVNISCIGIETACIKDEAKLKWAERRPPVSGHGGRGTPGPIPNPEAKPPSADGTAGEARGRAGRR